MSIAKTLCNLPDFSFSFPPLPIPSFTLPDLSFDLSFLNFQFNISCPLD